MAASSWHGSSGGEAVPWYSYSELMYTDPVGLYSMVWQRGK